MNKVSPAQQEKLLNVGVYLQGIRKEQGKAIDEVANQIFIRPALVQAIEDGNWDALPEPIFVQGFIRRYADHLGLDGLEISKQFRPPQVSILPDLQIINSGNGNSVVTTHESPPLQLTAEPTLEQPREAFNPPTPETGIWKWALGLAVIGALTGIAVWFGTQGPSQIAATSGNGTPAQSEPDAASSNASEVTAEPASDGSLDAPAEVTGIATNESTDAAPITFNVNLEGDSWMRIQADGEEVYEGTLPLGTRESWTAENELRITAGNSGAVLYSFNGSDEAPLGAPGSVRNLTLTPDTDPQAIQPQ